MSFGKRTGRIALIRLSSKYCKSKSRTTIWRWLEVVSIDLDKIHVTSKVDKKPLEFQGKVIYFVPYNLSPASTNWQYVSSFHLEIYLGGKNRTWMVIFMTSTPSVLLRDIKILYLLLLFFR